jgi:hypothetical protein
MCLKIFNKKNKDPKGRYVTWYDVSLIIKEYAHPSLYPPVADKDYLLVDDPISLILKYGSKKLYIKGKRDCDDFVRIVRGNLSKAGLGHILCMDTRLKNHSCLGFIDKQNKIKLYDAQTFKLIDASTQDIIALWV